MKKDKRKIKRKINNEEDGNNDFLLKCPFNFCDRNCEKCIRFRESCAIYQEENQFKLRCIMEDKNPDDPGVIFEHVGNMMAKAMGMLSEDMEKMGIKITDDDIINFENIWRDKERQSKKHPLYKKCRKISQDLVDFSMAFQISSLEYSKISIIEKELKEIYFYENLIFIKIVRALHSGIEEGEMDEVLFADSLISASISFYSLCTVERSLNNILQLIGEDQIIWNSRINTSVRDISVIKKMFLKYFPEVKYYKNKIIFNGQI